MKNGIITTMLLCSIFAANAQTERGSKLIGVYFGDIRMNRTENNTSYSNTPTVYNYTGKSLNLQIGPTVAWFISDNLALGGNLTLGYYKSESTSSNTGSSTTTTSTYISKSLYFNPTLRKYFGKGAKGKPFAEIGISSSFYPYESKSSTSTGSSSETTTKTKYDRSGNFRVGYEYFVSPNIGFFAMAGVQVAESEYENKYRPSTGTGYDYTTSSKGTYFPISFGLQIHCISKKDSK